MTGIKVLIKVEIKTWEEWEESELQMKSFYEPDDKDLRLAGLVGIHVDDLNTIGTEKFHRNIIDPLQSCVSLEK